MSLIATEAIFSRLLSSTIWPDVCGHLDHHIHMWFLPSWKHTTAWDILGFPSLERRVPDLFRLNEDMVCQWKAGEEELEQPAQSSDLDPTEHLWYEQECQLRAKPSHLTSVPDLTNALVAE